MSKKVLLIVSISAALFVFLCSALFINFFYLPQHALPPIGYSNQSLPFSLTVYGRSTDTISIRFAVFNPRGEVIAQMERSLRGWEVTIDTILVKTSAGWLVFPFRLYTDQTLAGTGIDLLKMFRRSATPPMYDFSFLKTNERNTLSRLFFLIQTERFFPRILGTLHHQFLTVRDFNPGVEYSLYIASDGTLSLSPP